MKIITLLENMLNQKESIKFIVIELTKISTPELEEIFSNLEHYFADEDIRTKEIEYKDFQNNELEKLIHYIKVGNIEKANQISFLQATPNI
jgi:endonuclease V-like protein UPF0215 family